MSEPEYEYRVVTQDGRYVIYWGASEDRALQQEHAEKQDRRLPKDAPHRLERRLVTTWEDVPDAP